MLIQKQNNLLKLVVCVCKNKLFQLFLIFLLFFVSNLIFKKYFEKAEYMTIS